MAITFRTTYDEAGNPQRVKIGSGTSFESGRTYSPNVDTSGQVQDIQTDRQGRAIADPQLSQSEAISRIEGLGSTPSWDQLRGMKNELVGTNILTTDKDENRNMYQYLINEMLRSGKKPRGAKLIDETWIPEGWTRTGSKTWTDPNDPNLWRDIKGLNPLTDFQNPGVYNLEEHGGGLAQFPKFKEGWAQDELGIKDWGAGIEGVFTGLTPLKYAKMLGEKLGNTALDVGSNIMDSSMMEAVKEDWRGRKKGKGLKGFIEDVLTTVGIGNTKKTNEFIETQTDTDGEIKTNMEDIKTDKKKTINLHELTDLKAKRNELYNKITQGGNEPGLMAQYEQITSKILELEQGQLQDFKEGGIASLATGGLLEKERVQQSFSPLNSAMNYGIGGLGTLFGQGGPRQHPIRPRIPHYQQPPNQDPWGIKPMGEQITGFGETLGGFGEQMTGFGEQLGGYQDALGGYGQDISSFKETMGGFGNQFENINNKLTAVEEGIASLSDKIGTTQGNTQPQGMPNFGYGFNAYSPWMFGGFGRGRYG